MFDRYDIREGPSRVSVDITERRAPTDDSVRLLREMEQKARAEVLRSLRLEGNAFRGLLHHMNDPLSDRDLYACVFDLNGKRIRTDIRRERDEESQQFLSRFCDALAQDIAREVLRDVFTQADGWVKRNLSMSVSSSR